MTGPQPNNPFCRIPGSRALLNRLSYNPQEKGGMDLEGHLFLFVGWTRHNLIFNECVSQYSFTPNEIYCWKESLQHEEKLLGFLRLYFINMVAEAYPGEVPRQTESYSWYLGVNSSEKDELVASAVPWCTKEPDEEEPPIMMKWRRKYKASDFIDLAVVAGGSSISEICGMTGFSKVYVHQNLRTSGIKLPDSLF